MACAGLDEDTAQCQAAMREKLYGRGKQGWPDLAHGHVRTQACCSRCCLPSTRRWLAKVVSETTVVLA